MNHSYTSIIIDDEQLSIDLLQENLASVAPYIDVTETSTSWSKALEALRRTPYDIIFLDISMQGRNGMDLLKIVPELKSEVIFITAYAEYALDAFRLAAAGYIVKPVDPVDLANTLRKTTERIDQRRLTERALSVQSPAADRKIGIPQNKIINYVSYRDIIMLEAWNAYTKVHTTDEVIICSYNIGKLNSLLDRHLFFQVHRSFVVNLDHVARYDTQGIIFMDNNTQVPVSRNFREDFLGLFTRINR